MRLFSGRRIDLDALSSQAKWRMHAGLAPRNAPMEWLWRAVLLALFTVVIVTGNELAHFHWREVPAIVLPFAVVAVAGAWLRRMNIHITLSHMPCVALPFEAAPWLRRLQLSVTAWLTHARVMLLSLAHFHFDERETVQSIQLFAQRVSNHWLKMRLWIEAALEMIIALAPACLEWIISPCHSVLRAAAGATRAPRVVVLRC